MRAFQPRVSTLGLAVMAMLVAGCGGDTQSSGNNPQTQLKASVEVSASTFGLTQDATYFTIDTGAGLVFKIRRQDFGSHTQSPGDIASLMYKGVQYQDWARGSQVNSGFDWLYKNQTTTSVTAETVGTDYIKVTVKGGDLVHYYIAKRGVNNIYMGTYFTREPDNEALVRYIVRVPYAVLPHGPAPSDLHGTDHKVESGDIFGMPNGETRSKHYSNMRLKDWQYIGATGDNVGMWIVRDNNEGNSGGPFYRSLLNQAGSDQELTYIVNYGEAQTEPYRFNILNTYTLVFNDGAAPGPVDTSFLGDLGLTGYVGPSGRGEVEGLGIVRREPHHAYTVGFSNAQAQYWAPVDEASGHFDSAGMLPGTYTMKVYKNELAVESRTVTVTAGEVTRVQPVLITGDPANDEALWRIGDWDGTPTEFINGDKLTTMHPSDVRMSSWTPGDYVVGVSDPATGFPAYQWKGVNGTQVVRFDLPPGHVRPLTLRVGITTAYAGGRPMIQVNNWSSPLPPASAQPKTRTLTIGSYRGNNTMYTYNIPASALVEGTNVLKLITISGSGGSGFLSPGFAYDAVDLIRTR
jgi:rhamnogalacturonan endolyase